MATKTAYLILADGTLYQGQAFGAETDTTGEVVFTTSMTGYQESLTDPGSIGTILCQTFPSAGNYGLNSLDNESPRVWAAGYVAREWCEHPSNFRCEGTLDRYLREHDIPGLCGIDTRALTRHLRQKGSLNGAIVQALPRDMDAFLAQLSAAQPSKNAVQRVSRKEVAAFPPQGSRQHRVVLYDFGVKESVIRLLAERGCEVVAVPFDYPAEKAKDLAPDGILLSNGPTDIAALPQLSENVAGLACLGIPLFGVDFGHLVLAKAMGAKIGKLPFGHHGENQPVVDLLRDRTYITSQSHNHTVLADSIQTGHISHLNANDDSVAGIHYPKIPAFSVQFHPEACAGPEDTVFLFDLFVEMMHGR